MLGKVDSRSFTLAVILTAAGLLSFVSRASAQGCQTISGLTYGTYVDGGGATQSLLLELMVPTAAPAPVPLVIWVHGGGWSSGSRLPIPSNVSTLCDRGFAVASIDYRFTNVARWPAQIQDCKGAVRWLRAHAAEHGIDPGRFGVWGASAGGQLVAMLGTSGGVAAEILGNAQVDLEGTVGGNAGVSSRVQAVVDWYGAIDFLQMRFFPTPSAPNHDASNSAESKLIGGPVQDNPELSATASPLTYITPDDPPFLVMHGTNDTLYPFHQSRLLVDALAAQGVPVTFTPVPNAGHGGSSWNPAWVSQAVWDFFAQTLAAPAPPLRAQAAPPEPQGAQQLATQPVVSIQATDAKGAEAPLDNGQFRISLNAPLLSNLTVAYHTAGTATGGADYVSLPGTATIPAGQTAVTVDLQVMNDIQLETGEYVILALDPSSAYQVGTPAEASVVIADDDYDTAKPIVSAIATDFSATEPGVGTDTGEFAVTRTGSTSAALTVSLLTGGSAVDGTDYTGIPAAVTFDAGVSRLTVTLEPQDDLANEGTEAATLTVAAASGMYLGRFDGNAVALLDDEPLLGTLALSSLSVAPAATTGGGTKPTGTVVLNGPAPAGGVSVALASSDPAAAVPASVTVPAGASSAAFSITTQVVTADRPVTISATFRTASRSAPLTVQAPVLSSLSLTPASFVGGCQTSAGKVTLTGKAPAGGIAVSLENGNPAAAMPASVTVAAGATSATFIITAPAVTSSQAGTVTATQDGSQGTISKSGTLTVRPVGLASLALSPNPVTGPAPVTGTVTLECAAAPGPITVTVTTTSSVAQPPPSLTIQAGQTTGTFSIATAQVAAASKATIKAAANGTGKSVTLTVNP